MSFVLLVIGALLLVSTARGTQQQLFTLVKGDFTGPNNFIYWFISILLIGALGYIEKLRPISNMFLALVIVVLFLKRGAFFSQFSSAIATTTNPPQPNSQAPLSFPFVTPTPTNPNLSNLSIAGISLGAQNAPIQNPLMSILTPPTLPSLSNTAPINFFGG